MWCFLGVKPYSHTPISLFTTRGLVHTRTEGAYTWCCTRSVAPTRVHAPHLQAQRHTQRDVGRGGAGTGTHVHTGMCTHARSRCTARIAHQLRHTAPTQRTPTQTAFLSLFTHAHPLRPLLLPVPILLVPKTCPGVPPAPGPGAPRTPCLWQPPAGWHLWLPSGCSPGLCSLCATVTLAQPSPLCLCQHRDHSDWHQVPSEPWGCWGGLCMHWECVCVHKCGAVLGRGICVQGDVFTCMVCTVH